MSNVPHLRLDGVQEPHFFYTYARIQSAYEARKATPTNVTLELTGSYAPAGGDLALELGARSEAGLPPGDYRLHAVLTESNILWAAPNGLNEHDHTLRKMLAGPGGVSVSFSGNPPQSAVATFNGSIDPAYATANCRLVCFLQDAASGEVYQALSLLLTDLPEPTATDPSSWSQVKSLY